MRRLFYCTCSFAVYYRTARQNVGSRAFINDVIWIANWCPYKIMKCPIKLPYVWINVLAIQYSYFLLCTCMYNSHGLAYQLPCGKIWRLHGTSQNAGVTKKCIYMYMYMEGGKQFCDHCHVKPKHVSFSFWPVSTCIAPL